MPDMGWLKSLADFIRSWRGAFAIFAAAATVIAGRLFGYLATDLEFVVGFIGACGLWMMVALGIDYIRGWIVAERRTRRIARLRKATEEQAAARAEQEAGETVKRSIANLRQLEEWEEQALLWIYHQPGSRARASINDSGIDGLRNMGLLRAEDPKQLASDRIWVIPDHIVEALQKIMGERNPQKAKQEAPWVGQRSGW